MDAFGSSANMKGWSHRCRNKHQVVNGSGGFLRKHRHPWTPSRQLQPTLLVELPTLNTKLSMAVDVFGSSANIRGWSHRCKNKHKLQRTLSKAPPTLNTKLSIAADAFGNTANLKHQVVNDSGRFQKQRQHDERMKPPPQKQTQIAVDDFGSIANLKHQVVNCSGRFWKHRQPLTPSRQWQWTLLEAPPTFHAKSSMAVDAFGSSANMMGGWSRRRKNKHELQWTLLEAPPTLNTKSSIAADAFGRCANMM